MRNVPKLRFKEFSGEWEEKKLGEIADIKGGYAFKSQNFLNDKSKYQVIKMGNIYKNKLLLDRSPSYLNEISEKEEEYLLKKDDIILTLTGTVGKRDFGYSYQIEEEKNLLLNQRLACIKNKNQKINIKFLKYIISHKNFLDIFFEISMGGTGNQANVSIKDICDIVVKIATYEEQEKIADFLSSVDKKISITEEKLDLFKEYKKGIMQKIFKQELRFKDNEGNNYPEWEEKRLGDVFSFKQGYQIPFKEQIKTKEKGYVRYLYISDFFSDKNLLYVKDDGKEKITETDITVANTGNTAGSFYRGKSGILSNNMFNIQNDEKVVTNDFLFQFLGTSLYSNQLKTFFNSSGQPHLGHKNMSMIIINYPISFEEQQKIVDFLSSIDNKIDNLTSELEDLKKFKKGLLQQMFV